MSTHIHPIVSVETDDQGWRTGAYTTTATTTGGKRAADRELVDGIGVQQGVRQVPYSITMPLVILSGYPCSGKTAFAELLASTIRASSPPDCKVVIINEESLHMGKQEYYSDATREKLLRQNLKSAVDHVLNSSTYVILDSLNYIKGYRYELYCIARSQRTPHCVVLVENDYETSRKWNEARSDKYDADIMEDLRRRFERPNEMNRWDKPLFIVSMTPLLNAATAATAAENAHDTKENPETEVLKCSHQETPTQSDVEADVKSSLPCVALSSAATTQPSGHTHTAAASSAPTGVFATSSWKSKKKGKTPSGLGGDVASVVSMSTQPTTTTQQGVYFSGSRVSASNTTSSSCSAENSADVIVQQIITFFQTAEVPVPNAATMQVRHADAELLYQLDRVSQLISHKIMSHQQNHRDGTPLVLEEFNSQVVALPRFVSLAEVQRLRGQFVKINSQHPPANSTDVGAKFIEFLMNQL